MTNPRPQTAKILVVEDNPGDARLVQEALKDGRLVNEVRVATDGEAAVTIIDGVEEWRPDLVLLDLRLPNMGGHEVLEHIRSQPATEQIPVIVMSSSDREEDVSRAYIEHANAYVRKPLEYEEFIRTIQELEHFWLAVVTLPPKAA